MSVHYITALVITFISASITYSLLAKARFNRRRTFIDSYAWPSGLISRFRKHHPSLAASDIGNVERGLRQFFQAYHRSGNRYVSMPSQVVDDLWHEFILHTRDYQRFCQQAFGQMLHHTPAARLSAGQRNSNEGLRRVWWHTCKIEGIDPGSPAHLPLLFDLDQRLNIPNGYRYEPDCMKARQRAQAAGMTSTTQCGGDFGSSAVDGSTSGFGSDAGSAVGGDSSSDSGGSDGGGCGGGGGD